MGLGGYYGDLFVVVMINAIIDRLTAVVGQLFSTLLKMLGLRVELDVENRERSSLTPIVDDTESSSIFDPMNSIMEEICESLRSTSFKVSERSHCEACAVCLNEFEEQETIFLLPSCSHIFHTACFGRWLNRCQTTCPLCRCSVFTQELVRKHKARADGLTDPCWRISYGC